MPQQDNCCDIASRTKDRDEMFGNLCMDTWPAHKDTFMKKSTLFCAASLALVATSAYAEPKINGRVVVSLTPQNTTSTVTNQTQGTPATTTKSNYTQFDGDARLRFSGKEALNDKVDFIYSLDYQLAVDTPYSLGNFSSRDTYVGLAHKDYGKVQVGRQYTRDYFARVLPDNGFYHASDFPWASYGERTNNAIQYHSPAFGPNKKVTAFAHYALSEAANQSHVLAGNINYDGDKFDVAAGFRSKKGLDTVALAGTYAITDKTTVGATINQAKYSGDNTGNSTESAILATVFHKYTPDTSLYAQAGKATNYGGFKDGKKTHINLGVNKTLKDADGKTVDLFGSLNYADVTSLKVQAEDKDGNKKGDIIKTETKGTKLEVGIAYFF